MKFAIGVDEWGVGGVLLPEVSVEDINFSEGSAFGVRPHCESEVGSVL